MLTSLAPAKINLVLEVLGKRADGYHQICSLIQTISLCDAISFELAEEISLECTVPDLMKTDNLVIRAAQLLRRTSQCPKGARIELEKLIPWASGLGGGSSDAAVTLLCLNELWQLGLSTSELIGLAAELGSDVPFFIYGGMAVVQGRGEKVTPLSVVPSGWVVLLLPQVPRLSGKTQQLYSRLTSENYTDGKRTEEAVTAFLQGGHIAPSLLFNVFDGVASRAFPELERYQRLFQEAGASHVHLAGSGPTLFAFVDSEAKALELERRLRGQGLEAYAASTIVPRGV